MSDGTTGATGTGTEQGQGGGGTGEKTFTQVEVNKLLAEHKRNLQAEATKNREAHESLRQQVEQLLQGRPIDEVREEMETTASRLRSTEEQSKQEQAKFQKLLKEAQTKAESHEQRYRNLAIGRALKDAALAADPSTPAAADLISKILYENASVDDKGVVTVEMEVEEEGIKARKKLTPGEAVSILQSLPSQYGPLFKSGMSGGVGNNNTDGIMRGKDGKLDIGKMSMQQYAELRKKNPHFLDNGV